MDTAKLRYFLNICKKQSISKAADNLFITQQGLSKSIKTLENELKVNLFTRTSKGLELTEYGNLLKNHAEVIIAAEEAALEDIKKLKEEKSDIIDVCFAMGVLNSLSIDFIQKFNKKHPNINLHYIEYPDFKCQKSVLGDHSCLGVVLGPVDTNKFDFEVIKKHAVHAIVNHNHPLSKETSISINQLNGEPVILMNEDYQMYHNFINACKEDDIEPSSILKTGEIFITYKMSSLNNGIGISVDFVSKDLLFSNVKSIPIISDKFTWDVTVIKKKGKKLSYSCETFLEALKNELKSHI